MRAACPARTRSPQTLCCTAVRHSCMPWRVAPSPAPLPYCRPMRRGLPVRMLAGLLIGIVLGVAANLLAGDSPRLAGFVQYVTEPAGRIFLRLLFMLVIPLILSALALGVAGLGDLRSLGRIGLKTLVYTVVGLGDRGAHRHRARERAAPRRGPLPRAQGAARRAGHVRAGARDLDRRPGGMDFFVALVPANIVKAMGEGDMLAVMVFALFLGVGLALTKTGGGARVRARARRALRRHHEAARPRHPGRARSASRACSSRSPPGSGSTCCASSAPTSGSCCWGSPSTSSASTRSRSPGWGA